MKYLSFCLYLIFALSLTACSLNTGNGLKLKDVRNAEPQAGTSKPACIKI